MNAVFLSSFFIPVIILNLLGYIICDDIIGCGGFVKSDYDINYSRVEIKLYTKHGSLKYHTDCAPVNGYYLIPVYDKGDYILKIEPPAGWNFEPNSVALHIDGVSDPCSLNKDINFIFKGFTVTGQVLSRNSKTGPSGIKLVLRNSEGKIQNETFSIADGHYTFSELLPGKYTIEAYHKTWVFDESAETIFVNDNLKTENKIIVSGYDVSGFVYSDGQPIQGVHFLLFSKNHMKSAPLGCSAEQLKSFSHEIKLPYLCHVPSSSDGNFLFPSVPPGHYKLIPFYKGEHIEFDVSPTEMDFTVEENSFQFSESFQIQGFSVSGWIGTGPKGSSLSGVNVFINDELQGTSDENGIYHLENMRAGTYKLKLLKELMFFETVEMKINPNTPRLPDIYVNEFSICGEIFINDYPTGLEKESRNIILKSLSDLKKQMMPVTPEGKFCCSVSPGKYELEPIVTENEASSGLKLIPSKKIVEVIDKPVLNVDFKQFIAKVHGKVKCIDQCNELMLELTPLSQDRPHLTAQVNLDGSFVFENCLPDNYVLTVIKDDWCFQTKTVKFVIDKEDIHLELHQIGFQVKVTLTHASSFEVKYPSGELHNIELTASKNALCLPEKGVYEFIPVGCHLYKKDVFKFDTSNPSELTLIPTKHLVTGSILTEINVTDIKVFIKKQSSANEETISLQEPLDKKENYFRYTFSVFAHPHSDLELRVSSKQLLFRLATSKIRVNDDCMENAVEIIGKLGVFLNGSITPPLEGVRISVYRKENLKLFTETVTNKKGLFYIGPLEDIDDYTVKAETDGYFFTQLNDSWNFKAIKLAEINVKVINEDGSPLPGVLLSLSGGIDYRKNSITQKNGQLSFIGLSPGQYYLRPVLKEFNFIPPSKVIDIGEGVQVNVKISGKRVAYSLYGVVTSLTGEAEVGIAVEAAGIANGSCSEYQEEAISEHGGSFRIRGLQPHCEYLLRLKPTVDVNQHIERSLPKEIKVKVTDGDITGVRMIVFRYYGQMDVSGNVLTNQEYLQTLKVRLYREDVPDQIVHSVVLGQSSFFYLPSLPIDNGNYILRLESSLSSSAFHYEQPSVSFCANTSFYHFTFSFTPQIKSVEQEVTQGSVLALPVAIIALLLAYNYSKLLLIISHLFNIISKLINPTKNQTVENTADSGNIRRKARPKRIQ